MAGDWIKMRSNLWDDPRVARLCDATDEGEATIVGALYWLWAVADQHTTDGFMPGLSGRQIDRKTGVPGLAAALADIGWLEQGDDGMHIVRFNEHNGASAKKRAMTARRVADHKKRQKGNAGGVTESPKNNAPSVTETLPERDLEKEKDITTTSSAAPPGEFPMTPDWQPGKTFRDRCRISNVEPDIHLTAEVLGEFKSYRMSTEEEFTQSKWEHKLLQHLIDRRNRYGSGNRKGGPARGGRAEVNDAISDIGDTSWASQP